VLCDEIGKQSNCAEEPTWGLSCQTQEVLQKTS
jgi:hypothetical protein